MGFHALNADPNIAALQDYTIKLYPELEAESGQSCGLHLTGGVTFASDPDRWEWLQSAWAVFQAIGIETSRLVTPDEIAAMNPLLDMTGIKGGLHDVAEGYLDPNGTTHAYAKAAQKRGANVIFRAAGALVDDDSQMVRIGRDMVSTALTTAPRSIRLRAPIPHMSRFSSPAPRFSWLVPVARMSPTPSKAGGPAAGKAL